MGVDGTIYDVVDGTFVNATSATFKMGDLSSATTQVANRPYKVRVTGASGLTATSTQTTGLGGAWTSPAAGATLEFNTTSSMSKTLAGTDALGGNNVTFEVAPGSALPGGLSLNAGVIFGTIGAVNPGTNVTFRVVYTSGAFVERTFSIVGISSLYEFTSPFTFTNAGVTGRTGPTLTQLQDSTNGYGTTGTTAWVGATSPAYLNMTTQGIQEWTVPATGTYQIEAAGAGGATEVRTTTAGYGFIVRADVELTSGQVLSIVCGQVGVSSSQSTTSSWKSGGGGASWVYISGDYQPILVGGGGGGGSESGTRSHGVGYNNGWSNYSYRSGSTVQRTTSIGGGGPAGNFHNYFASGAGGAGWFADGFESTQNRQNLFNGRGKSRPSFVGGTASNYGADGGFGGGAGGMDNTGTGGGGGGYTGGPGGDDFNPWGSGGGGSSYLTGSNQVEVGVQSDAQHYGYVTITKL